MSRHNILAPSILSANFNHLGEDIQTVISAGAEYRILMSWMECLYKYFVWYAGD